MLTRHPTLLTRLTALLLSVATPTVPVGMALMRQAPAAEAMAPMAMDGPMEHQGMHHDAPGSPADAFRCCDLCVVACQSTGTLPAGAHAPVVAAPWYETFLAQGPALPVAATPSLRLPFAQAPPLLLI